MNLPSSKNVSLLHLSDLHLTSTRLSDQKIVIKALIADLKTNFADSSSPNAVLFSGDLVNNPDERDSYTLALDNFILPVLDSLKLNEDSFFMVPGNHDIHRSVVQAQIKNNLLDRKKLTIRDEINEFYESAPHNDQIFSKSKSYFELKDLFSNPHRTFSNSYVEVFTLKHLNLSIIALNTSWASLAGLEDDRGQILFPEQALNQALENLPTGGPVVIMGHHPLEWFSEQNGQDLQTAMNTSARMYLCGHIHRSTPMLVNSTNGNFVIGQSGAFFEHRDRFNGYSLIRYEKADGHLEFILRSYFERRRAFDQATDVCKDGKFHATQEARDYWFDIASRPSPKKLKQWLGQTVAPNVIQSLDEGLTIHSTSELFVPPRLSRESPLSIHSQDEGNETVEVSFYEFCELDENSVIIANQEYGKSTLLRQVAVIHFSEKFLQSRPRLPLLLDFSDIRPGKDRIITALRNSLPILEWESFTIRNLLEGGHCVILIDDFVSSDERRLALLFEFFRNFPQNRYIMTSNNEQNLLASIMPKMQAEAPIPLNVMYLLQPTRHEIRQLVKKWPNRVGESVDAILDRLFRTIVYINVPATAVNATILLSIFDDDANFKPINQAVLIERFVELLLEKQNFSEALRGNFDYRNKEHFLSTFAHHMVISDTYRISYESSLSFAGEYLRKHGLKGSPKDIIDKFCEAKVLIFRNDEISFRYRAFLEFFIAKRIEGDAGFKEYVFDEKRYLLFVNEIEYFAALRRDSKELLDLLRERFLSLDAQLGQVVEWERSLKHLDRLKLQRSYASAENIFAEIEGEIQAPKATDEERDALLDGEFPRDIGERQDVYRPLYTDIGQRWMAALTLYSGVLRNSELIEDAAKRVHLKSVLYGWGMMTLHSFFIVPSLVKHRYFVANGVSYHVLFPPEMNNSEVALRIYWSLPRAISDLVKLYLGSEKLEKQLGEDDLEQSQEELIVKFFRRCLYSDLKLPDHVAQLKILERELRDSDYLYQALALKSRDILRKESLLDHEHSAVQHMLADMVGRMMPGDKKGKIKAKGDELSRLRRARIISQFKMLARNRGLE